VAIQDIGDEVFIMKTMKTMKYRSILMTGIECD
jgi:hypothetical protein